MGSSLVNLPVVFAGARPEPQECLDEPRVRFALCTPGVPLPINVDDQASGRARAVLIANGRGAVVAAVLHDANKDAGCPAAGIPVAEKIQAASAPAGIALLRHRLDRIRGIVRKGFDQILPVGLLGCALDKHVDPPCANGCARYREKLLRSDRLHGSDSLFFQKAEEVPCDEGGNGVRVAVVEPRGNPAVHLPP